MNRIHLIYFSPTHTSAQIAYEIAAGTGIKDQEDWDITHDCPAACVEIVGGLAVVAVPVYGGRVAETAVERLRSFRGQNTPVIPVVVYGNRDYEDALRELTDLLIKSGFRPVAAGAFIGEHSYSRPGMPVAEGRPDGEDLAIARDFGRRALLQAEMQKEICVKGNFPYKVKGPSTPQAPVTDEILCTQCEYCMDICPVKAISIVNGEMFSNPQVCIKCCVCVKECPEGARTFDTPYTAMLHQNFSRRREPELFE